MNDVEDRERKRLATVARNIKDEAPIIADLRGAGFAVEGVADLFNKKLDYLNAVPILVAWLPRITNPNVKEGLVRALSVKWARDIAELRPMLVAEFKCADDPTGSGLRWAIGNALEVLANDDIAEEMINLARDRKYGSARQMVVVGLGKLRAPRVVSVLVDLLADDDVVGRAVVALRKLKAREARPHIERLLGHPRTWVRNEAKKALASLGVGVQRP